MGSPWLASIVYLIDQIEQKLLESAESLLVADHQSQTKNERRAKAISTHKSKIFHLQTVIAEAKGERHGNSVAIIPTPH